MRISTQYSYSIYSLFTYLLISIQATNNELRSQITALQTTLEAAREEIAARKAHEAKLTSQFQVCLHC